MSEPKAVVNKALALWDAHDLDGFLALLADDAVFRGPAGMDFRGKAALADLARRLFAAYANDRTDLRRQFVDGVFVITEARATSTHTGDLTLATGEHVPPTGRIVSYDYVQVDRVVGEKIVETIMYFDRHAFLEQIGQVPAAAV